jgi:hypothetical protein
MVQRERCPHLASAVLGLLHQAIEHQEHTQERVAASQAGLVATPSCQDCVFAWVLTFKIKNRNDFQSPRHTVCFAYLTAANRTPIRQGICPLRSSTCSAFGAASWGFGSSMGRPRAAGRGGPTRRHADPGGISSPTELRDTSELASQLPRSPCPVNARQSAPVSLPTLEEKTWAEHRQGKFSIRNQSVSKEHAWHSKPRQYERCKLFAILGTQEGFGGLEH